jgi:Ca2+-binding RTX toxin-like protein
MSLFDFSNVKLTPQLEATAQINLALQTGLSDGIDGGSLEVNQNLPSIKTDLEIDWGFELGTSGFYSDDLSVVLHDVRLDIGDFLGEAIAPILKAVDQALDPIRPLLDILNTKIPVLSDLSELFGSGPVTFLDAFSLFGSGGESAKDIIRVVTQIAQFVDDAAEFAAAGDVVLNFGTFDLTNLDLSAPATPGSLDFGQVRDGSGNLFSEDFSFDDALNSISGPDNTQVQNSRTVLTSLNASDGLGITFPILSPENIFKLLFGQTADLVNWQLPVLSAEFSFSQRFGPIIPPFPIFAELGGALSMFADFRVGLDTRGLQTGNFLDGFFFDDFKNGVEAPELGLSAQFTAGASLSLGIASAGVRGGIRADITADWNDPVPDSKIYGDKLALNIARGLDCVFDLHGAFKAFLEAFVEVELLFTSWRETFELASVTLFEFNHSCPPIEPDPAGISNGSNYGDLAAGTLVIHTGQFTANRFPGATDGDDEVLVTLRDENAESRDFNEDGVRDLVWEVKVNGDTKYFKSSDVSQIYVDGGEGNDRITIKSSTSSGQNLAIATTILGGNGDDQILGGTGADVIKGGAGKDNIQGGDGNDNIEGGEGNDQIFGNVGQDTVDGGVGDDVLHGDDQNAAQAGLVYDDVIKGGEGNDQIFGEHGDDDIEGGNGKDRIKGGDGIDTIKGGQGIDIIDGDRGNDDIEGGDDADVLSGNAGNDKVRGSAGDDQITDLEGNNQLYGEGGNDQITAGGGSDLLDGGADNDTLTAGAGDDYLEGGTGNDTLHAGEGSDRLIGGSSTASAGDADGDDLLYGEGGDDILLGDHGIISAAGVISRIGGAGNDQIFGGAGNDTADGQGGNDLIEGGIDRDRLFGGTGDDTVRGQEDNDYIEGGAGSDQLFGGQGDDAIIGGVSTLADLEGQLDGSDLIQGDAGNDVLLGDNGTIAIAAGVVTAVTTEAQGGSGADHIFGGVGNDILFGGGQGDLLVGDDANNSGDDIIVGDQGLLDATEIRSQASTVASASGNDTIFGSGGNDIALGGGGDDQISGDRGLDILLGDHGVVTRNGVVATRIATSDPEEGGTDTITGGTEDDVALGGTGDDNLSGGTGADILLGDNGVVVRHDGSSEANDIFSQAPTFGGRDTINGDAGDDIIVGGSGGIDTAGVNGDQLFGNDGNDVVVGDNARITRNSSDVIERIVTILPEHGGDDTLEGNVGDDILIGGSGSDRIWWHRQR